MADAGDLKSPVHNGRAGSSPAFAIVVFLAAFFEVLFLFSFSRFTRSLGGLV